MRDLTRIGERARRAPNEPFTSIYHYVTDEDELRASYEEVDEKAPGVDGVTKKEYGENLEGNLEGLSWRLRQQGYRPQPVRRSYIPKAGSPKKRPLGIPCLEDKIVQVAVKRVLEQIYEEEFLSCSYGYRPGRTAHKALDELGRTLQQKRVNYVVEADIRGYFDHVNHEWMMKFLEERIQDKRILRLVEKMLKAGVMEDGLVKASDEGVPQGGSLSPLLSNIYLHYALDLWFERSFRRECKGRAYYFRFADDFLACFEYQEDARKFLEQMRERLGKFHLEIEPSKTKLLAFGRRAAQGARGRGQKVGQFDFLGFTHYCGTTRNGNWKVKRRTSKKKFRAKLEEIEEWVKKERSHLKKGELLKRAKARLVGHLNYYAITDNGRMCDAFKRQVTRMLYKWMNRQSQKRSYTWERFHDALAWAGWPSIRIKHDLDPFLRLPA